MGFDPQSFTPSMADKSSNTQTLIVISTSFVALLTGFLLGVYSARGYLITPEFYKESRANYDDPVDSDETDVDEDDLVMDHAPNWANGEEADRRQGLRATAAGVKKGALSGGKKGVGAAAAAAAAAGGEDTPEGPMVEDTGEECKLVLVVRTDLGMTKGEHAKSLSDHNPLPFFLSLGPNPILNILTPPSTQAKSQPSAPTPPWPATRP